MSVKLRGIQNILIVIALLCSLLSFTSAPAQAIAPSNPTCAEGGPCVVGDTGPGGGKVFYVSATTFTQADATGSMCTNNCLYLEVAPSGWLSSSEPLGAWSYGGADETDIANDGTAYNNALGIGLGYKNSRIIVTARSTNNAAGMAVAYNGGSKNDWYLPTSAELNLLCQWARGVASSVTTRCSGGTLNSATYRADTSGFVSGYYWSSSERDASNGRMQTFDGGQQGTAAKTFNTYVRPIRAFAPTVDSLAITRASVGTQRGTAFTTQPQITVKNPGGETVTASSAIVTATISLGGTIIGTTTATASSGVATFSNLGIDGTVSSTYTITYSATGLVPISAAVTLSGTICDGATFTCQVGDTGPGGGKIFYVAPTTFTQQGATGFMCSTACKYLEAAPTSGTNAWTDAFYRWSGNINTLIGTTGTAIGTGYKNTQAIVTQSSTIGRAARVSESFRGPNILTDWFLPSKDELNELYMQKAFVGSFQENYYWSSSESDATNAFDQNFLGGSQGTTLKDGEDYVRAIRAFGASPTTISVANVVIPAPVTGAIPVSSIASNGQYTTAITWSGSPTTFAASETYTATVTITPVAGYTFAGVGNNFFTVNGNSATNGVNSFTASTLGTTGTFPVGIAVDSNGNIYTVNQDSDNVSKITPQGVSTILGSTGRRPIAIAVDGQGNVFVNNTGGTITKITPSGVSTLFGTVAPNSNGIVIDSLGNVYTVSGIGQIVQKITPLGGDATTLGATGASPIGIAVDALGNVYTANSGANNVSKITPLGVSSILGTTGATPFGIAVDTLGNVYTTNIGADNVSKITPQGTSSILGATGQIPLPITVDSSGNVYTTEQTSDKIYKLTAQGVSSVIGSVGLVPEAITVDSLGNVYTADSEDRVIKFAATNSGVFTYQFLATAAPVVYVAPTPIPYLKTLTTPRLNLKDGKLVCVPGTYNAGYTLDGVVQGSTTTLFTPSTFTYNLLINGIAQTSLAVTSSNSSHSWNMPAATSNSMFTCSTTVTANGLTNTDKSSDNTSGVSLSLATQSTAVARANSDYSAALNANSKAYQKALVDNRTQWRSTTEKIRTDYYAERDRIRSLPSTKATRALSSAALKIMIAAQKKSAADYKASQPAAVAAREAANKAALEAKNAAIAKANATYGTAIESIGYGVLIP